MEMNHIGSRQDAIEAQVPQTEALWLQPNWSGPLKSAPGPGSGLELVESFEEAPG